MGTYALNNIGESRLFWLGRYVERVYTTIKATGDIYDASIDGTEADYPDYCAKLGIPNVYESTIDFVIKYLCDETNPSSIVSSMTCAMDNAMVMRQILGTNVLSYIEMALYKIKEAADSPSPRLCLQSALDNIMAFRGACDEDIDDDVCRNTIKTGASMERCDLYLRLGYPRKEQLRELNKLLNRMYKTKLPASQLPLSQLIDSVLCDKTEEDAKLSRADRIACIEELFIGV